MNDGSLSTEYMDQVHVRMKVQEEIKGWVCFQGNIKHRYYTTYSYSITIIIDSEITWQVFESTG